MSETNDKQIAYRLRELSDGLERLAGLARELHAEQLSSVSNIDVVWPTVPLSLRLRFVRDILPEESRLQPKLRQAQALEELRLRGDELETWLTRYPSHFADAVTELNQWATGNIPAYGEFDPAEMLAQGTLAEAKQALDRDLERYQIDWISSAPGEVIGSEHEVVGAEPSAYPKATIARSVRFGFRRHGKLELPAQVVRSTGPDAAPSPNLSEGGRGINSPSPKLSQGRRGINAPSPNLSEGGRGINSPSPKLSQGRRGINAPSPNLSEDGRGINSPSPNLSQDGRGIDEPGTEHSTPNTPYLSLPVEPEWLRILCQRTHGCDADKVIELIGQLRELVAVADQTDIFESSDVNQEQTRLEKLLAPLAPLLSMRYADSLPGIGEEWGAALLEARDAILLWLQDALAIEPISPQRGESFDAAIMDAIETRRTVHANEIETVARVERIGLKRSGSTVLRAQVVRYAAGRE